MKVVPAVLSRDPADYREKLDLVASFTDYAQLDFMDGVFVPSESIDAKTAGGMEVPVDYEAHLMVTDPIGWARELAGPRQKRVIFHYEAVSDAAAVADVIRSMNLSPGLALNPGTPAEASFPLLDRVDMILIMSVNPGYYGSPFIPEVLDKAVEIRKRSASVTIGMDGGVSADNIDLAKGAGLDYVCVGSRILLADDPAESFARLNRLAV